MNVEQFKATLKGDAPPPGISGYLAAMWQDGKGDWEKAHNIAQEIDDRDGAWIHAYLHRKEGDPGNAQYWYRQAGRSMPACSLAQEWDEIVTAFLNRQASMQK